MNYPFEIKEDVALEGFAKKPVMKIGMTLERFKAFIAEGIEYIWVAIVKFSNTKVLRQYAICENLTRNPKNVADISDVVSNVISAIAAGDCNKNKSSINTYLKEIG